MSPRRRGGCRLPPLGAVLALVVVVRPVAAQGPSLHEVREAEDARAATPAQRALLRAGTESPRPIVRAISIRALGRLGRAALFPRLLPALTDPADTVRAEAAFALLNVTMSGDTSTAHAVRSALRTRLAAEREPRVVGAVAEALGWTPHPDSASAELSAQALVEATRAGRGDAPPPALDGALRGLFGLARQRAVRGRLPAPAVARLAELARHEPAGGTQPGELRALAVLTLAAAAGAPESTFVGALHDPALSVRLAATRAIAADGVDTAAARRIARLGLGDTSWQVRSLVVSALARRIAQRGGCAVYRRLTADPSPSVRIPAVDALTPACDSSARTIAIADSLSAPSPALRGGTAPWHVPAHALVALARLDPARARARLAAYGRSPDFFVREYAARAATEARDTSTLYRLAGDPHPNVRSAAVAGLASLVGHAADQVYVAALGDEDSQLAQTAAAALAGSPHPDARRALLAALRRTTALRRETLRDARLALLERLRELGDASTAPQLRPYLTDYDTLVAARAAEAIGAWTGSRPTPHAVPLPRAAVPGERELAALSRVRLAFTMSAGGTVVVRLDPFSAPTNAARVARLVRGGRLDGLTFHRAVLGRFVQGGSPAANEYAGWGAYTRDEFAARHRRGAVSMSTRGYDTADGQIVFHIADNVEYDHRYTVIGEIVSGLDVVEAMQEGARIAHARVLPPHRDARQ